jgi:flavin-dependent dehydrogenase
MANEIDVAILGGGPAGATLAALLAMRGMKPLLFDDERRPDLLVGESLLPTVVTLMRQLGIEDEVRAVSQLKPGVSFLPREGSRIDFFFPERARKGLPNYAYNVPRPAFDDILSRRARALGVHVAKHHATLEVGSDGREIQLSRETLDAVPELGGRHPKLLIDATGRARLFSRFLDIGADRGGRNDAAYFAHYENFDAPSARPGQVVITTLECGWCWRIPLPGRMSVGVVIDKDAARAHGKTPEERLESIIECEPSLRADGANRRRLTRVMTYGNYQLISHRAHGPGWVAVGDAFGFVDPMLSPGLFMAMLSAWDLDRHVFSAGPAILNQPAKLAARLSKCEATLRDWHAAWREIIEYFYDGRIHSLHEGGSKLSETYGKFALPVWVERHLTRQITGMVSGARTRSRYGRRLLRFGADHLAWGVRPPEEYAIRSQAKAAAYAIQSV